MYKDIKYSIKTFIGSVKNLIYWFKTIWKDKDWDDYYIWIILEKKLIKQAKYIKEKSCHLDAHRDAERMMTCVRLIQKVRDEFYHMEHMDYQESVFHFDDVPDMPDHKQLRIEELSENYNDYFKKYPLVYKKVLKINRVMLRKEDKSYIAMHMSSENHKRAKQLLFKLLNEYIETWWD